MHDEVITALELRHIVCVEELEWHVVHRTEVQGSHVGMTGLPAAILQVGG